MINNAGISAARILAPSLTIVPRVIRHREQLDRRRNYFFFKRIFDVVFALVFIICILSWLLPLLCLLIKLTMRGPVFFLQKRIGRGGKSFTCYKLRTMVINAESDTRQAADNDNRITSLGWFLRKTNMDEFPQFFNILKGDMSVIGPRPHMYADCTKFSSILPGYKFRNMVRPGLTGLAQVKGYHGPATTTNAIMMRFHWDNHYIRNIGWLMDLGIIFQTITQRIRATINYTAKDIHTQEQKPGEIVTH